MGRAPIVITSTLVGVALVLGYNPRSGASAKAGTSITLSSAGTTAGSSASAGTTTASTATASGSGTSTAAAAANPATGSTAPTGATTTAATTKAAASTAKATTATGSVQDINENGRDFGSIQVTATVSGGKVTGVSIASLQAYDGRSQSIDENAVPQLQQQSIDVGSAQIDGVSGATYTSQAYATSLQAALDKLGA